MDDFWRWKLTLKIRFWHFLTAIFGHITSLIKKSNLFLWSVQSLLQSKMFFSNSVDMMKNLPMASKTQLIMSKGWDTKQSVAAVVISSIHSPQSKYKFTFEIMLIKFSVNFILVKLYQVLVALLSPYLRLPFWKSHFPVHMSINKNEKINVFQLSNLFYFSNLQKC